MRLFTLLASFLVLFVGNTCAVANFNFKSNKQQNAVRDKLTKQVDDMVKSAMRLYEKDDSFAVAVDILKEAYFQANKANYTKGIISSALQLGDGYRLLTDFPNATSKYYIAMRHAESIDDSLSLSLSFRGLGLVKYSMKQWSGAISDFNRSSELGRSSNSDRTEAVLEYLLALCYYNLGEYEVTESVLIRLQKVAEENGDKMHLLEIKLYLNNIAVERSNSPEVLKIYDELIDEFQVVNEKIGICHAKLGKAKSYLKNGDYVNASKFALLALDIARNAEINYPMQEILEVAIETEYLNGQYKASSDFMRGDSGDTDHPKPDYVNHSFIYLRIDLKSKYIHWLRKIIWNN